MPFRQPGRRNQQYLEHWPEATPVTYGSIAPRFLHAVTAASIPGEVACEAGRRRDVARPADNGLGHTGNQGEPRLRGTRGGAWRKQGEPCPYAMIVRQTSRSNATEAGNDSDAGSVTRGPPSEKHSRLVQPV